MATKAKAVVLSNDQMGFITATATALTGWIGSEAKGQKDLKALKVSGFKWVGTARNNPGLKALFDACVASGQSEATARNSLTALKAYYLGDVGGPHKFVNGLEIEDLNPSRMLKRQSFKGLLDGKPVKVDRDDVSCAGAILKAMNQEGFELVMRNYLTVLGADPRKLTTDDITKAMQDGLVKSKLAFVKDGKLTVK